VSNRRLAHRTPPRNKRKAVPASRRETAAQHGTARVTSIRFRHIWYSSRSAATGLYRSPLPASPVSKGSNHDTCLPIGSGNHLGQQLTSLRRPWIHLRFDGVTRSGIAAAADTVDDARTSISNGGSTHELPRNGSLRKSRRLRLRRVLRRLWSAVGQLLFRRSRLRLARLLRPNLRCRRLLWPQLRRSTYAEPTLATRGRLHALWQSCGVPEGLRLWHASLHGTKHFAKRYWNATRTRSNPRTTSRRGGTTGAASRRGSCPANSFIASSLAKRLNEILRRGRAGRQRAFPQPPRHKILIADEYGTDCHDSKGRVRPFTARYAPFSCSSCDIPTNGYAVRQVPFAKCRSPGAVPQKPRRCFTPLELGNLAIEGLIGGTALRLSRKKPIIDSSRELRTADITITRDREGGMAIYSHLVSG
jgi:hypothetical protein